MDSRWSRDELSQFSLTKLRGLDIRTMDEEKLVQEIVNAKLLRMPIENPVNADISLEDEMNMTPEKEKKYQEEVDRKMAEKRARLTGELMPGTEVLEDEQPNMANPNVEESLEDLISPEEEKAIESEPVSTEETPEQRAERIKLKRQAIAAKAREVRKLKTAQRREEEAKQGWVNN